MIKINENDQINVNENILICSSARSGKTTKIENFCLDLKNNNKSFIYFTNNEKICLNLYKNIDILDNENFYIKFKELVLEKKSFLIKLDDDTEINSEKLSLLYEYIKDYYVCIDELEKFNLFNDKILNNITLIATSQSINHVWHNKQIDLFEKFYIGRTVNNNFIDDDINKILNVLDINEYYKFDKIELLKLLNIVIKYSIIK